MSQQQLGQVYGERPPENYERYFVPAIGLPLATDLIRIAALCPGERVLDVACGTGVVTRLASARVGSEGVVAGLDLNLGMLAVARSTTASDMAIDWYEANAEAMPFPDSSFDVVLCQMGLQFMPDRAAALSEMRRVLAPEGRLILNVPGPAPKPLAILSEGLKNHIGVEAAAFVNQVFSLYETADVQQLIEAAGFRDVQVQAEYKSLRLPGPKEFLWQYLYSTPLANVVQRVDQERRASLENEIVSKWQAFTSDRALVIDLRIVTATARKLAAGAATK